MKRLWWYLCDAWTPVVVKAQPRATEIPNDPYRTAKIIHLPVRDLRLLWYEKRILGAKELVRKMVHDREGIEPCGE